MQREQTIKSFLNFSWGAGSEAVIWSYHSKAKKRVRNDSNRSTERLDNGAILTNPKDFDDGECKIIKTFAQNLYEFQLSKDAIVESNLPNEKKNDQIFQKSQEANFAYATALRKAAEVYENTDLHKSYDYLSYYLLWKLAEIFYMSSPHASKTQEFCNWMKSFPDILETRRNIEATLQMNWNSIFYFLAIGEFDNVITILKNIKTGNKGENLEYAIHETIVYEDILKRKLKFYKGDDCTFLDKNSFVDQSNREREKFNKLLDKWRSKFNEDDEIIVFLKVLTGDVEAIQRISFGDWKKFINLLFLFYHPFPDSSVLTPVVKDFLSNNQVEQSDSMFISVVLNNYAFEFLHLLLDNVPAWFTFHLANMLYLFKQVPNDPIVEALDEETPGMSYLDMVIQLFLDYILQVKLPFEILKYYVSYLFAIYDEENTMPPEYANMIEQLLLSRADSNNENEIRGYLRDLENKIYTESKFPASILQSLRAHLLKRIARTFIEEKDITENNMRKALEEMERIDNPEFLDGYAKILINDYEDSSNPVIPKVLFELENLGSSVFQTSKMLNFILNYTRFRDFIQKIESQSSLEGLGIAKSILIDLILDGNSPQNMRLLILNYAIDLFENPKISFTPGEIEGFINKLAEIEDYLQHENPDPIISNKIIKSLKLCLMRCLSRSIIQSN